MNLYGIIINENDLYDVFIEEESNNISSLENVLGKDIIDLGNGFIRIENIVYFIDDILCIYESE